MSVTVEGNMCSPLFSSLHFLRTEDFYYFHFRVQILNQHLGHARIVCPAEYPLMPPLARPANS